MTPEERFTRIENAIQALTETQARHDTQIEKQNAGIRDLIVLNRMFLDSQKEVTAQIQELREADRELREALKTLTENVDKLIRGRGPNGHIS